MSIEIKPTPPVRLTSLDAYRGFVMFLMMAECIWRDLRADHDGGWCYWCNG